MVYSIVMRSCLTPLQLLPVPSVTGFVLKLFLLLSFALLGQGGLSKTNPMSLSSGSLTWLGWRETRLTELSPLTALFVYQSGAVVISVVYAYIFYKVVVIIIERFAPLLERYLDQMAGISQTQGEILEVLRRLNGKAVKKKDEEN